MAILNSEGVDVTRYLQEELHSESTLPLLSYFVGCRQRDDSATQVFTDVKAQIGKAERPIPDESEQLADALLKLIEEGPGGDRKKRVEGSPKVSGCFQDPPWTRWKFLAR